MLSVAVTVIFDQSKFCSGHPWHTDSKSFVGICILSTREVLAHAQLCTVLQLPPTAHEFSNTVLHDEDFCCEFLALSPHRIVCHQTDLWQFLSVYFILVKSSIFECMTGIFESQKLHFYTKNNISLLYFVCVSQVVGLLGWVVI